MKIIGKNINAEYKLELINTWMRSPLYFYIYKYSTLNCSYTNMNGEFTIYSNIIYSPNVNIYHSAKIVNYLLWKWETFPYGSNQFPQNQKYQTPIAVMLVKIQREAKRFRKCISCYRFAREVINTNTKTVCNHKCILH